MGNVASYIVAADGGLNRLKDLGLEGLREEICVWDRRRIQPRFSLTKLDAK